MNTIGTEALVEGTYTSADGNQILYVSNSSSTTGTLKGVFTNKSTPLGTMTTELNDGNTRFVYVTYSGPTSLGLYIWQRDEDWDECLMDYWVGSVTNDGQLIMSGAQSLSKSNGEREVRCFNNVVFTRTL